MAALTLEQISGIANQVLDGWDYGKWVELGPTLTEYPFCDGWLFGGDKSRKESQSGKNIGFTAHVGYTDNYEMVGLYDVDDVDVGDNFANATVPWKHSKWAFAYDEHEVTSMSDENEIVDFVEGRAVDAWLSAYESIERDVWTAATSSTAVDQIWGFNTWIVKGSNGEAGFYGDEPSGFSSIGLDVDTYGDRWRNYFADYASITDRTDFLAKLKTAATKTGFIAPLKVGNHGYPDAKSLKRWLATNLTVQQALETLAENQNDNLGRELDSMHGRVVFRGIPVQYIPVLDSDTQNPFYGIDLNHMKVVVHPKWSPRNHGLRKAPNQRNVMNNFWDMQWNMICRDRRRQFLLAAV
jgi:hypothetical protein